jgi:hypothetical protein
MGRTAGLAIKPDEKSTSLETLFCAGCRKEKPLKNMTLKKVKYVCRKCEK